MNLTGTIGSLPMQEQRHSSDGNPSVTSQYFRFGNYRRSIALRTEADERTAKSKIKMSKSLSVSPEINLLGKTVDEAVAELDKYLDDALLSHLTAYA